MQIDPIVNSTATGITTLAEYGLVGTVACIGFGVAVMAVWILLNQAKACFEGTKQVVDNNTKAVNEFKESNAKALHGVQLALVELRARMDR